MERLADRPGYQTEKSVFHNHRRHPLRIVHGQLEGHGAAQRVSVEDNLVRIHILPPHQIVQARLPAKVRTFPISSRLLHRSAFRPLPGCPSLLPPCGASPQSGQSPDS